MAEHVAYELSLIMRGDVDHSAMLKLGFKSGLFFEFAQSRVFYVLFKMDFSVRKAYVVYEGCAMALVEKMLIFFFDDEDGDDLRLDALMESLERYAVDEMLSGGGEGISAVFEGEIFFSDQGSQVVAEKIPLDSFRLQFRILGFLRKGELFEDMFLYVVHANMVACRARKLTQVDLTREMRCFERYSNQKGTFTYAAQV